MQSPRVASQGDKTQDHRPEWLQFPNNLQLASIPHQGPGRCPECQAEPGQRHVEMCPLNPCPKCDKFYPRCGCNSPTAGLTGFHTLAQMKRAINALATQYLGEPTNVDFGTMDSAILLGKHRAFAKMVALSRASQATFMRYTRGQLKHLRDRGQTPRDAEQAIIMANRARELWESWFWR